MTEMTREEALKIVDNCDGYINTDVIQSGIILDGAFTMIQLEAILALYYGKNDND